MKKKYCFILPIFILTTLFNIPEFLFAEGSASLYPQGVGGRRAYLMSWPTGSTPAAFNPFPTPGTMKVYVKTGETIYVGSSAQGKQVTSADPVGTIILKAPNGNKYSSGTTVGGTVGLISTRAQELAGPNRTGVTSGYTPYTRVVQSGEEGIWEIDFVSPKTSGNSGTTVTGLTDYADAQWTLALSAASAAEIAAFDVSVGSAYNPATLIPGRMYCNVFNGTLPGLFTVEDGGFNGVFYVLTSNGTVYKVDNNGQNGFSFAFFVNNKGLQSGGTAVTGSPNYVKNGTPSYLSADAAPPTTIYDPRLPDNGAIDINHKLFFAPPANDLPVTSDISFNGASKTTTWLKKQVVTPLVTNLTIMGAEGVPNVVGPKGAYINFNSNSDGSYKLVITCTGFASRTLTGTCVAGANSVLWDGKDGNGTSVSGSVSLDVTASLWASEVHFPFVDVEINTKGFIIQRLNTLNAPVSDIVYWDDSNITTLTNSTKNQTPSNPKPNGNTGYGLSSTSNGHKWGAIGNAGLQGTSDFGNNRTLDTWTYVPSSPVVVNAVPILAKKLDLELTSITPSLATTCPGSSVTYTIVVKNLTGTGYVDAVDAKFGFTAPSGFNITGYTFTQTSGTASQSNVVSSGNQYTANINLTVGGTITYTITGTVSSTPGIATAYIMRPADVTDVDATSSTGSGIPTDPQLECDGAAGGGSGCNNIKTATVTIVSLTTTGIANGMCSSTGAQTTGLTYTASTSNPNSYSIDWNTAANNAGLVDQGSTSFAFAVGGGTMTGIVIPANTPGGTYSGTLTIRNASGCTNSYPISLTLGTLITAQPVATSTCSGTGTVAFTVTAINATGYLWKKDGVNVTNGTSGSTVISGATTSTLTITNPTSTNAGSYTVAVIGSCGNVTSNAAALTISALPAITSTGVVAPVCYSSFGSNQTTTMPYTATTNSPISYSIDWNDAANTAGFTDQGTTTFAFVPGGGTITGIIIPAGVATGTIYNGTMTVTTVNGCTATKAITYTPNPLPTVTTTGIAVAKCYSASPQTTTLPYTASTNSPTSYSIDWDEIANAAGLADQSSTVHSFVTGGSTITSIAITAGTPNGRYNGVMTYTNANGCTNTVGVSLTIGAAITVQPVAPAPVCSGSGTVILSVTAEGSGTLTYRWRKGGSNLSNGGVIAGATTATLTLTNPTAADAGIYDVVVTSSCGSVTSNAVMVTVGYPTNVTATANQTSICEGSTLTLTGTADGATSWSWSGPNGFTSTLKNATVPGITTAGSGVYTLTATNGCGSTTASTLSVTVNSLPPTPTVSTTTPTNVCPVKTVNLTTLLTNAAGMTVLYKLTNSISGTDVTIPASVGAGTYYIFYQNASGCTSSSSTAVTVTISNCPPLPLNDINTTYTNKPVSGNVLTNDSDPEGNTLTVTTQSNVATLHGTVTVNSNGTYTYTPANGYTGTDTFSYQVCDNGSPSQCSTASVTINVVPPTNPLTNDPPVANNDTYTVEQGQTATVEVLANDSDPDGNTITVTTAAALNNTGGTLTLTGTPQVVYNASSTQAGTAYLNASGQIVFTPTATYTGNVPFNYTISDGKGGTASASALVTVLPANATNDVNANDDANAAPAGTTMTGNILTNDFDPEGNTITITAAMANGTTLAIGGTTIIPGIGTLTLNSNGTFTFVPVAGYIGTVNVPYTICDNGATPACDQATLYLTSLPVTPVASNDINQVPQGVTATGTVLTNDEYSSTATVTSAQFYNNSGALTALTVGSATTIHTSAGTPAGNLTLNSDGTYTFVPATGFTGVVPVNYTLTDAYGTSSAVLSINVVPPTNPLTNDPPVANNDTYTVEQGQTATVEVLANDSDPDGNTITVTTAAALNNTGGALTLTGAPQNVYNTSGTLAGTAYLNASGQIVFTPTATYTGNVPFNYTISDGNGGTASASAQVTVLPANATNDVNANDDAKAAPQGVTLTGNVLTNDSDPEGNTFNVSAVTIPAQTINGINVPETVLTLGIAANIANVGTITISQTGEYTFVPVTTFTGTLRVPYTIVDTGTTPIASDQGTLYLTSLKSVVKVWTGNTSTDFNTSTNWSSGVIPVNGDDIVFATVANYGSNAINDMILPNGSSFEINNLTNLSTKATIIPANTTLIVTGLVTGSSGIADASKIQIKAAENTPNGTFIINCTAQSALTTPDVYVTVDLYAKGFKDAVRTWTDNVPGSPTYGNTFSGSYHWQHFGVPVASITANPTFYGSYLRKYFENYNGTNTQYYQKWKDLTNESNLIAFEGYEITQDFATTYSIPGKLQYCDKNITLTRSAPLVTGAGTSGSQDTNINNLRYGLGQNIFGNSYTASIDITKLNFPEKVEPTVYLYNTGRFTDWSTTTNGGLNDGTALSAGQYTSIPQNVASTIYDGRIPSMNGFLLMHRGDTPYYTETSDDPVTMTLPYANNLRSNTKPQTVPRKLLSYLQVNLQSKSTRDNLWLFSQEGTTDRNDDGWDGRKFFGTPTAFIYTENADGPKQVNADATIDGTVLSFYANDDTDYTLTLTKTNLEGYTDLQLIDLVTRTVTPLSGDMTTYHFTADNKGTTIKRFIIANSAYIDLNSDKFRHLDGYVLNNNRLIINNFTPRNGTMYLHDISGKTLINRTIPTAVTEIPVSLQSGVYIMNLQADGEQEAIKLIIK